MRKIYVILAAVTGLSFASCTNQEYLGDVGTTTQETEQGSAITFGGYSGKMTRNDFTDGEAASKLGSKFIVYGVKQNRTTATNYDQVFPNFTVQYDASKTNNAEYNNGWYYVGIGTQTIRYWDYSSANYHFVAGSPVANFTYATDGTTGDIATATVTGLGGRLNHTTTVASTLASVYIADPKVVAKADYKHEVEFTFRSMQSKVRVGIYETIPGYKITSISFYNNASTPVASNYITLNCATDNYFQGSTSATGTVTYDWTTPNYTFAYTSSTISSDKCWEGGQFTSVPATTSAATNLYGTDDNMASDGYFIVMPTPSAIDAVPLTLKCDYVLKSLDDVDEIHVTGATATIPADYTKWAPNTAYTYLFKISNNTNGSTGNPDDPDNPDPAGLYPITFDAVVVNYADAGQNVGTETTFSTPSITVYQDGDVVTNGITYKTGTVTVKAYEGTADVTSTATWSYTTIDTSTTPYDYSKDYEHLGASGAVTSWTSGALTSVTNGNTYVIKAKTTNGIAYFVLVVGAPENGPTNPVKS